MDAPTPPSPLDEVHRRLGAQIAERRGERLPVAYGDVTDEVRAVRQGAAVADLSTRGVIRVTGGDRATFLQGQLSNDIAALAPGGGCHATLLNRTGKLVSDLFVVALDHALLLLMARERVAPTLAALDRFLVADDAELEDASGQLVQLAVVGPGAREALERARPALAPADAVTGLSDHHHLGATPAAEAPRLVRRDVLGERGFELWVPVDEGPATFEALVDAGARPIGRDAWELAELEAGRARYGVDMDERSNPLEANLSDAISYTKGCYVGQEVIAKATHLGRTSKRLVGLHLGDGPPPPAETPVELAGEPIGEVTRAAVAPSLGTTVALAYVKTKHAEPGTEVVVHPAEGEPRAARIVTLPFLTSLARGAAAEGPAA